MLCVPTLLDMINSHDEVLAQKPDGHLYSRGDGQDHMTIKDEIHHLVDELDEDTAREALAYLHTLGLPAFLRNAPLDDEPETDEERAAVQEARDELERGEVVSAEEAKRRLLE